MNTLEGINSKESFYRNILTKTKEQLDFIQSCFDDLMKTIQNSFNNSKELFDNFKKEIDNDIIIIENKLNEYSKKEYLFKSLRNKYVSVYENISNIYDNKYLINIKNSIEKISGDLNILWDNEFDPPNINSFYNTPFINLNFSEKSNSFYSLYDSFLNEQIEKKKNNDELINCFLCKKYAPKYCLYCDNVICENCFNIKKNEDNIKKFELIKKDVGNKDDNDKYNFLVSVCNIIKKIFLMINSIYIVKKNNNNKNVSIPNNTLEEINYPNLQDINNFDSVIIFLQNINQIFMNLEVATVNINEFHINEIERSILNSINNIIGDDLFLYFNSKLEQIDLDFFLDE